MGRREIKKVMKEQEGRREMIKRGKEEQEGRREEKSEKKREGRRKRRMEGIEVKIYESREKIEWMVGDR